MEFVQGLRVEVRDDNKNAWFTASVIKPVNKKTGKVVVEYDLITDDHGKHVVEKVTSNQLRPTVPEAELVYTFKAKEKVEAFDENGWYEGKIKKLDGEDFLVRLKASKKDLKLTAAQLRIPQSWSRSGGWFPQFGGGGHFQ